MGRSQFLVILKSSLWQLKTSRLMTNSTIKYVHVSLWFNSKYVKMSFFSQFPETTQKWIYLSGNFLLGQYWSTFLRLFPITSSSRRLNKTSQLSHFSQLPECSHVYSHFKVGTYHIPVRCECAIKSLENIHNFIPCPSVTWCCKINYSNFAVASLLLSPRRRETLNKLVPQMNDEIMLEKSNLKTASTGEKMQMFYDS